MIERINVKRVGYSLLIVKKNHFPNRLK